MLPLMRVFDPIRLFGHQLVTLGAEVISIVRPGCHASWMASKNRGRRGPVRPAALAQQSEPKSGPAGLLWATTRSGARAGRGFHYQDAVGGWLCGSMLSGALGVDRIVPEGLEDLSCDGSTSWHVQVKSRQERVGDFTAAGVAAHLVTMVEAHEKREQAGVTGRPILVLERPVDGEWFTEWGRPLSVLPKTHSVLRALEVKAAQSGLSRDEIEAWCAVVSIYVLPWRVAAEETGAAVVQRFGLLPAAAEPVVLALRDAVAGHADANAERGLAEAAGLSRTSIERITTEVIETIDRDSLEEALTAGVCEPVDFDRPLRSAGFYEGIDVQPGHIAAGLPAPRPTLTGQVATAIDRGESILLTGPSGVGKSTVMWAAAYVTRHVLWYRIRRLRNEDTASLVRLARALKPSTRSPVGFVVDGIGIGAAEAWDVLHRELAPIPGVMLLGSVRSEDLLPLRSRADCTQIAVTLDEDVAEQIHAGLSTTGATKAPHWREAYEAADGLTLEFTHFLTRGRRLADVLSEQVSRRVVEGRQTEIEILARIAVAHRWGVDLPVRALQQQLNIRDGDLRAALSRLIDEHLIHERLGRLSGLHRLRSGRLADAVHAVPPPMLDETVIAVMRILTDTQLQPFVAGVLTECPDLDSVVLEQITVELEQRPGPTAAIGILQALRLVDFTRCAAGWARILDRHQVALAHRRILLQFALMGGDPLPNLKPEIAAATAEIGASGPLHSPLRDTLAERLGTVWLARALAQCAEPDEARRFLAVLAGTNLDLTGWPSALADSPFGRLFVDSPVEMLGDLLTAARAVSVALATGLLGLAGGEEAILTRLGDHFPWMIEASVVKRDGSLVAYARLLYVSDRVQPDGEQALRAFGRILLRCLPHCEGVDVQNLLPGGLSLTFGDFTSGVSRLQRQYDRPPTQVAWIRAQALIATTVAGTSDWTSRTAAASTVLPTLNKYLTDMTRIWCTGRSRPQDIAKLKTMQVALQEEAATLSLPTDSTFLSALPADDAVPGGGLDHLHLLVDGIVDNLTRRIVDPKEHRALAGFARDSLNDNLSQVRERERWQLIDQEPPPALDEVAKTLTDLHAVLAELVWGTLEPKALRSAARSGPSAHALARAADLARAAADTRASAVQLKFQADAETEGLSIQLYARPTPAPDASEWPPVELAVGVELADLNGWPSASERLSTLMRQDPSSQGYRRPVLFVPLVDGRPVRLLALQLHTTLWPGIDLFDTWGTVLPEACPTPLTNSVIEAHQALQCLSGLAHLTTLRDTDQRHQRIADQAVARFQEGHRAITELGPGDSVIVGVVDFLSSLAVRVESEFSESAALRDSEAPILAVAVAQGMTGHPTDDYQQLEGLTSIALQWDLDPSRAASLLARGDG
ncbi:hypothetical protein ACFVS9_06810 [Streptomyces sp. NPDC058008]|uniref:hypothetical protein n=1 Tax=Streptomyces sp. NPDC058008 TaxID=3346303 RepID=UPI0036EF3B9C